LALTPQTLTKLHPLPDKLIAIFTRTANRDDKFTESYN